MTPDRTRWDARYADGDWVDERGPIELLSRAAPWLSGRGWALDLACGAGRNARAMAEIGYDVVGVDLSVEGLRRMAMAAAEDPEGTGRPGRGEGEERIHAVLADANRLPLAEEAFVLVMNSYFLLRSAFPAIRYLLAPGGILVFETFNVDEIDVLGGDIRRAFALEKGELLEAFDGFEVLLHEEGVFEEPEGERGLTRFVARKPE